MTQTWPRKATPENHTLLTGENTWARQKGEVRGNKGEQVVKSLLVERKACVLFDVKNDQFRKS